MSRYLPYFSGGGVAGTTVNQALMLLSGVGSGVILARSLGPGARGELAVVLLWPGILGLLGDLGLGFAFSYFAGKGSELMDELWTLSISIGLVTGSTLAVIGRFIIPYLVHSLRGLPQGELWAALCSIPIILMNGFQAYLLLGKSLVADYNLVRITASLSYFLLVVIAASLAANVRNFVFAYLASQAIGMVLCTCLTVRRFRPRFRFRARLFTRIFSYGLMTQIASIAAQTSLRADQAVMSVTLPSRQLGLYSIAVSVSGILSPLMSALAIVILPRATHSESDTAGVLLVARHVKLALILSAPVILLSVASMPWALPLLFGAAYIPAVRTAQILALASLFQGLNAILGNSLRGLGRPGLPAIAEGAGMIVALALLVLLLPSFGIAGAAVASLIAYFVVAIGELLLVARVARINLGEFMRVPVADTLLKRLRLLLGPLLKPSGIALGSGRE